MSCLDDETVLGYLQRRLPGSRNEAIERHLDRCAACRRLIAALAGTSLLPHSVGGAPAAWTTDFLPAGVAVGRYVVEQRIGSGATGIVYRARDPQLARAVAIKRLRAEVADDPQLQQRFVTEARTLAGLSHANLLPVYDVGEHEGHLFVAMELVDGVTLRRAVIDRRREDILDLYRQAARGLVAAHEAGVCHGDFKPDNVLVTRDGRVLVADFGLLGTPAYMAPEQLDTFAPSEAADQFAWCVALFEALTGERPFGGDAVVTLRDGTRRRALSPAIHRLPRSLQAVLRRGLAEQPSDRWPSLAVLSAALDRRRSVRRWPWLAAAVAGIALAAVPTTRARSSIDAEADSATVDVVSESTALRAAELAFAAGRVAEAREHAQTALVNAQQTNDEIAAAAALVVRGRCEGLIDRVEVALQTLGDAYALAIAKEDARAAGVATDAATEMARLLAFEAERPDEAEQWLRHAAVALERHGPDDARALALEAATATLDVVLENLPSARQRWARVAAEAPEADRVMAAQATTNLGVVLYKLGLDDEAGRTHEEALALLERAGLESHYVYGRALMNLANVESRLRQREAAREHGERAFAVFVEALGPRAALVGRAANNLGKLEVELGNLDAGERAFDHATEVLETSLGADHPALATVLLGRAGLAMERGRVPDARDLLERAAAMLERARGLEDPSLGPIHYNLGELSRILGDFDGARRHSTKSLEVLEHVYGPDHPDLALHLEDLGNILLGLGDLDEAERLLARAHAIRTRRVPDDDPSLYRYWLAIGKVYLERDDYERADAALERAAMLAEDNARLSAVQHMQAESLWRQGHRRAAIALTYKARRTLGDDVSQPGLAASIDGWLAERVGTAK